MMAGSDCDCLICRLEGDASHENSARKQASKNTGAGRDRAKSWPDSRPPRN